MDSRDERASLFASAFSILFMYLAHICSDGMGVKQINPVMSEMSQLFEAQRKEKKMYLLTLAPNEDSNQPALSRILIRVSVV